MALVFGLSMGATIDFSNAKANNYEEEFARTAFSADSPTPQSLKAPAEGVVSLRNVDSEANFTIEKIDVETELSPQKLAEIAHKERAEEISTVGVQATSEINSIGAPVARMQVNSPFGYRFHPVFKTNKMHNGVDFGGGHGTPILSAELGQVIEVSHNAGYGNYVKVQHSPSVVTVYAHLSSMNVSVGQVVDRGTVLGGMGNTGVSTGTHLHFEVQVNGVPQNPMHWIR